MRTLFTFLTFWLLASSVADGATIQFDQSGWSTGATLKVAFSGQDVDNDGSLTQPELTSFSALLSGLVSRPVTWGLSNIEPDGFVFTDLNNYLFFTRTPDFSLVSTAFEGEVLASVFDRDLFPVDSTATPPTAAPEPGGSLLAGLALVALVTIATSRRKAALAAQRLGTNQ